MGGKEGLVRTEKPDAQAVLVGGKAAVVQPYRETAEQFLGELLHRPALWPLGFYSRKTETCVPTNTCTWMFIPILFISPRGERIQMSTDR